MAAPGRCWASLPPAPGRDEEFSSESELYTIFLKAGLERQGIGRRLFHGVIAALPSSGRQGLYVVVLAANPNCSFYARMGGLEFPGPDLPIGDATFPQLIYRWENLPEIARE